MCSKLPHWQHSLQTRPHRVDKLHFSSMASEVTIVFHMKICQSEFKNSERAMYNFWQCTVFHRLPENNPLLLHSQTNASFHFKSLEVKYAQDAHCSASSIIIHSQRDANIYSCSLAQLKGILILHVQKIKRLELQGILDIAKYNSICCWEKETGQKEVWTFTLHM